MAPFAEKDEILVTARVWHQHPPGRRRRRKPWSRPGRPRRCRNWMHQRRREMAQASVRTVLQADDRQVADGTPDGPAADLVTSRRIIGDVPGHFTGRRAGCPAAARAGSRTGAGAGTRAPSPQARQGGAVGAAVVISVAVRGRNRTPRASRTSARRPRWTSARRGPPRRLRPRCRRPGRSRSLTIPITDSPGRTSRRRPSARHPDRRSRPICSRWFARARAGAVLRRRSVPGSRPVPRRCR